MLPKTFYIRARSSFKGMSYRVFVHAPSASAALEWAARVFEGVDTAPTLRRWAEAPRAVPRVGNSDPVVVHDCDRYRNRTRVSGRFVVLETEPGQYRRSTAEVAASLREAANQLHDDRARLCQSFASFSREYARSPTDRLFERLTELKAEAARLWVWQKHVTTEHLVVQDVLESGLELPARVAVSAATAALAA